MTQHLADDLTQAWRQGVNLLQVRLSSYSPPLPPGPGTPTTYPAHGIVLSRALTLLLHRPSAKTSSRSGTAPQRQRTATRC